MASFEFLAVIVSVLGLAVSITYYAMVLRNQNRTRQAQLFMQIFNRFNETEFLEAWDKWFTLEYSSAEEGLRVFEDLENIRLRRKLGAFFEGVGVLVREDLVDIRIVANLMAGIVHQFWMTIMPYIDEWREAYNHPRMMSETEYLYNALKKYSEDHPEIKLHS